MSKTKPIIYQLLPRLFANYCATKVAGGTLQQNGSGKLNDINDAILSSIRSLGATHIWYTGVIEHAHKPDYTAYGIERQNSSIVKGQAGSPYAITDYYDIDPDLAVDVPARMAEFENLVERTHNAGLKVIIDFVPNHVARQYHSDAAPAHVADLGHGDRTDYFFERDNNFYYLYGQPFVAPGTSDDSTPYTEIPAKASGNDCFTPCPSVNDWYETVKLNYGIDYSDGTCHFDPIPDTWHKMLHILLFWASKGVDGFRCDMAHMVPAEFWHWAIPQVKEYNPDIIFIAELYDTAIYRHYLDYGCFDYLYDKVNLYDTLRAVETSGCPASAITGCWQCVDGIGSRMLNFLENHDEQRFASTFYAGNACHAIPSLAVSAYISTGPFMVYFGQELGERGMEAEGFSGLDGRTTIFDYWSIDSIRRWLHGGSARGRLDKATRDLRNKYRTILTLANSEAALRQGSFYDLMYANIGNNGFDTHRQYAFLRHYGKETIIIVANFGDNDSDVEINLPPEMFAHLSLPEGTDTQARNLLEGGTRPLTLTSDSPLRLHVAAHNATIWKVNSDRMAKHPDK